MDIILASVSQRRRDLLKMMGISYTAKVSDVDESVCEAMPPDELVKTLARKKAEAVFKKHPDCCVIGADTIVFLNGEIIGKPSDEEDAARILKKLQGRTHTVYTGMAVLSPEGEDVRSDQTRVTFSKMTDEEISRYIATGEPMDKAGAYGVQGPGGVFIEKVEGNYFTVIGLNINILYDMLSVLPPESMNGNNPGGNIFAARVRPRGWGAV